MRTSTLREVPLIGNVVVVNGRVLKVHFVDADFKHYTLVSEAKTPTAEPQGSSQQRASMSSAAVFPLPAQEVHK